MTGAGEGGVLILVAGPSGAGKDTLIASARDRLHDRDGYRFPRRYITRQDQTGENHIPITVLEFERLLSANAFFLHWGAHSLYYGIPAQILTDLGAGRHVIVNVSRRAIPQARRLWAQTEVIAITVDPQILRQRIHDRGRESGQEIDARLARAFDSACDIPQPFHTFDNSGRLEDTAAAFLTLILRLTHQRMPADNLKLSAANRLSQKG